jgi:Fic family protein
LRSSWKQEMFKPNFHYTDRIIKNLTLIAAAREIILNAPLVPKWEVSLRRDALIKSAHSSTAIEGNPLTLEEVSALAAGREIMVRRKDKQEVLNYIEALERIPDFAEKERFTQNDLIAVHKLVTKETLGNPNDEGSFRKIQVYVVNRKTDKIVFTPPPIGEVPRLVNDFLEWFNAEDTKKLDPVIEAGITHYELVRIHPFIDGNGRTARLIATLVLSRRGFDVKRFFTLDDYYDNDRRSYYEALQRVDPESIDTTDWLEYFTEGVAVSIKQVQDIVIGLSKDVKALKDKGQIALTERQMKIVENMIQNERIRISEVSKLFNVTRQAALKEMRKLIEIEVVELKGSGRGAYYKLI